MKSDRSVQEKCHILVLAQPDPDPQISGRQATEKNPQTHKKTTRPVLTHTLTWILKIKNTSKKGKHENPQVGKHKKKSGASKIPQRGQNMDTEQRR